MTYFVADGLRFDAYPHLNVFAIVNGLIILVISEGSAPALALMKISR